MTKRKNINDYIGGDRSSVAEAHGRPATRTRSSIMEDVDDFLNKKRDYDYEDDLPLLGYRSSGSSKPRSTVRYVPCYESHKPLKIGDFEIHGGSCLTPAVTDAEIYIGFDAGMRPGPRSYPWKQGHEFLFPITDMSIPKNHSEFKKLVNWTRGQLHEGKKIHCGCIGGHGRTGMFFAALVKEELGIEDAITYVRDNYCHKVVESSEQVRFLHETFGIKKVTGSKAGKGYGSVSTGSSSSKSKTATSTKGAKRTYDPASFVPSIYK